MKEIITVIRPGKVSQTKEELEKPGFPGITALSVLGRGRQRGIAGEISCDLPLALLGKGKPGGMKYIPKRLISLIVCDADVDAVVQTILQVNRTGQIGDEKVFICPVDPAVRVRTNEEGETAIL